jgi:MATE family multidrug resistance protein
LVAAGLRGAGDTTFPVAAEVAASWAVMLVPTYVACVHLGQGLLVEWSLASLCSVAEGLAMLARYRTGWWRALRVIELSVVAP